MCYACVDCFAANQSRYQFLHNSPFIMLCTLGRRRNENDEIQRLTFAERLCALRKQKNLTQLELAHQLKITQEAVSQYELGKGAPRYPVLVNLAKALDTTTDYLLGVTEEIKTPMFGIFSEQEQQVVAEFRQLSPTAQERTIGYLHGAKDSQNRA